MRYIRFFVESVKLLINTEMMYRYNFLVRMITLMSFDLILPLVTIIIYLNTSGFPGWSFHEILFFQGVFIFVNSIDRMFLQGADWMLSHYVQTGNFDRYLLIPINTICFISFTNFRLEQFGNFFVGMIIMTYAAFQLNLSIGLSQFIQFLFYILLAVIFLVSLAIIRYAIIIQTVRIGRFGELIRVAKTFGQYPMEIYSKSLSIFFRYFIPLAIIAYYPTAVLKGASTNIILISVIIIIFFMSSTILWKWSLKRYTSAGG